MAEGTAVIDRGLPALRAVMTDELCTAILAVRQHSMRIFASTEPAPSGSSLDRGNCCISEDNFCRFIGHNGGEVTKRFSLRRLCLNSARWIRFVQIAVNRAARLRLLDSRRFLEKRKRRLIEVAFCSLA